MHTLKSMLKLGEAVTPPSLVSKTSYDDHCHLASYLPDEIATAIGFEVRLDQPIGDSGLALYIHPKTIVWEHLTDRLHPDLQAEQAWQTLTTLHECQQQVDSPLYGIWNGVWLEFDTVRRGFLIPDLFVSFDAANVQRSIVASQILETMTIIQNAPVASDITTTLATMINVLPDRAKIQQMGAMLARDLPGVRLVFEIPTLDEVRTYLGAINWSGDPNTVGDTMAWLADHADNFILSLDVGRGVFPRIGLEPAITGQPHPEFEPRWQHYFYGLAQRGYCTTEQRDALLGFSGLQAFDDSDWYLRRGLSHIKFVFQPTASTHVKAYFGFRLHAPHKIPS